MKTRKLQSLGFVASFDGKGEAVLSMPAITIPASAAPLFSEKDLAAGLRQGASRLQAAAEKIDPTPATPPKPDTEEK